MTATVSQNIPDILTGIFNALNLFASRLPANYLKAFLAVAKEEGRNIDYYARVCAVGAGQMSRRLLDLGEINRYHQPGFGLLESRSQEIDRRIVTVRLTDKGRALANQIARAVEFGARTLR
jgi:hypothetical protein